MPFDTLMKLQRFSRLRIKQLFDEARITAAWYSSVLKGKTVRDQKTLKPYTKKDLEKRYAKIKGLLWALGYPPRVPKKKSTKELLFSSFKDIHRWHMYFLRRVSRVELWPPYATKQFH